METRVEMHQMRYQNNGKGQFYEMLSLDLENGLYSSSERSWQKVPTLFLAHFQHLTLKLVHLTLAKVILNNIS